MKIIQLITLLLFISIFIDAQEPRTVEPVKKQPTPVLLDENNFQEPSNEEVKRKLIDMNQGLQRDIATFETQIQDLSELNDKLESASQEYSERLMNLIERSITSANSQSDLEPILKELKEVHRAYNSQLINTFENFDQKANQLFNILSTVMKANKEMEQSIVKNIR
jgi:hypothetical protein